MTGQTAKFKKGDGVLYKLSPDFFAIPEPRSFEREYELWTYARSAFKEKIVHSGKSLLSLHVLACALTSSGGVIEIVTFFPLGFLPSVDSRCASFAVRGFGCESSISARFKIPSHVAIARV